MNSALLGKPAIAALQRSSLPAAQMGPAWEPHHSPVRLAVESIFRQRWLFGICLVLIIAAATAATVLKKTEYKSEMEFLVEAARSNSVISADRSSSVPVQDVTEEQINSEIELMQSQNVIGAVVDPQWSETSSASRTKEQTEAHEAKISAFLKHLTVESGHKSNVVSVTYLAESPREAADSLAKLSAAYLAARKNITRPPGTSEFFAEETKRYKDAWDRANTALVAFQKANGLVSVPDLEEGLSQQIQATENQLRVAQAELAEEDQRQSSSGTLAAQIAKRQDTQQRLTPNQGAIEQVESRLVELKNHRTELLTRFQPSDRLVQEIDAEIADTTAALDNFKNGRDQESTSDVNPAWQQVRNGEVEAIVSKRATQGKISALNQNLAQLHQQLEGIQPLALQYNQLQEEVDQSRNNYEIFSEKRDESNIEDAMDEHKLVNIAVAEDPTLNFQQVAPRPLLYMVLGLLTAMFFAGSAVYLAEMFRSTIATPRELDMISRYPVLATVPRDRGPSSLGTPTAANRLLEGNGFSVMGARLVPVAIIQKLVSAMRGVTEEGGEV